MSQKVIVGMSGGVDSSVAAFRLIEQGYEVEGLFMKNWEADDSEEYCSSERDLIDAQAVATRLGITLHTVNFAKDYWDRVFEHFLTEYRLGRTPNPDILCNKEIKFKAFLDYAMTLDADFIATGHYARTDGKHLLKGLDPNKDQSYFLYAINPAALQKSRFPIGEMEKPAVRDIAKTLGLITHDKKDSTGICFIGERRFRDFLKEYLLGRPGPILTDDGTEVGQHEGLMYYTIGQRQGLLIGGIKDRPETPWYVIDKMMESNTLVVAQGKDHPKLFAKALICTDLHLFNPIDFPVRCQAKIRYRQSDEACEITRQDDGALLVTFENPQRAITPGQSAVFYDEDVCLGGATIVQSLPG